VDFAGRVSGLSGSCPALTFTAGDRTIATDASTAFHKSNCRDVTNGANVSGEGHIQPDGSVLADKIEVKGGRH
jgi:hypothetical protein